jgi:hypothetical protein
MRLHSAASSSLQATRTDDKETAMLGLVNGLLGEVGGLTSGLLGGLNASADVHAGVSAGADVSVAGVDVGTDLVTALGVHADANPSDLLSGLT